VWYIVGRCPFPGPTQDPSEGPEGSVGVQTFAPEIPLEQGNHKNHLITKPTLPTLSRWRHGFESRWGCKLPVRRGCRTQSVQTQERSGHSAAIAESSPELRLYPARTHRRAAGSPERERRTTHVGTLGQSQRGPYARCRWTSPRSATPGAGISTWPTRSKVTVRLTCSPSTVAATSGLTETTNRTGGGSIAVWRHSAGWFDSIQAVSVCPTH
jgi:hypothetical protein